MKRLASAILLAGLMATPHTAWTQPSAIDGFEAAQVAFDAAAARERQAQEARQGSLAQMQAREAEALRAARAEAGVRSRQAAELEQVHAAMSALLDRIEASQQRPQQLLVEQAVLQDWYDTLQPAVAHLTERSFLGAEAELAALAAAGVIEPGARRFRSYLELRNRLAEVGRRLQAASAERERERAGLRTQAQALAARRERLLAAMEAPGGSEADAAALRWLQAGAALDRDGSALFAARDEVEQAAQRVLDAAGRLRPPVLTEVNASAGGQALYRGRWERDGASADERQRERRRSELKKLHDELELAVLEFRGVQDERRELRMVAAEKMHRTSGFLQQSAARFRDKLIQQWVINTSVDVALTTAEVFVTGGAATLARKSTELGQQAARRAAAQRAVVRGMSDAESARIALHAIPGSAVSDQLRAAATKGVMSLRQEAQARIARMVAGGMARDAAEAAVMREIAPMITRLRLLDRSNRLANEISAKSLADIRRLVPVMDSEEMRSALAWESAKLVQALPGWYGVRHPETRPELAPAGNAARSALLSEGFEFALGQARNTVAAGAQEGAASLGRAGAMRARYVAGLSANKLATGVGVATGVFQVAVAGATDKVVNAESEHFGKLYTELEFAYSVYRSQLEADKALDDFVQELRNTMLKIGVAMKLLDTGLALSAAPSPGAQVSREDALALELGFSAPLARAPVVALAGVQVPVQRADAAGQRWRGTVPVARLGGDGVKPLSVTLDASHTAHASLDSDPSTPALRLSRRAGWSGFETGPDANHRIPLGLRSSSPPSQPVVEEDPFEAGRALVDAGAAAFDAQALVGTWIATGYYCDGDQPPETVVIAQMGAELVATKLVGDGCIRSGEVTWRGRLSGSSISARLHVRARGAAPGEDSWTEGAIQVVSRDELRGFGVTYRRRR